MNESAFNKTNKEYTSLQHAQINKQQNKLHTLRTLNQIKANITKQTPSSQLKLKANSLAAPPLEQTRRYYVFHITPCYKGNFKNPYN